MANVDITSTNIDINVITTPTEITVTEGNTQVATITQTENVIDVSSIANEITIVEGSVSESFIKNIFSAEAPLEYDSETAIFSIDESALFSGKTTDDLVEGTTNLYLNGSGTTSDLTEGTNLYHTEQRVIDTVIANGLDFNAEKVDDQVAGLLQTTGNIRFTYDDVSNTLTLSESLTTDDIDEGTNLYYTQDRFDTAFGEKSTDDLAEGSNLYFTTDRANTAISNYRGDLTVNDLTINGDLFTGGELTTDLANLVVGANDLVTDYSLTVNRPTRIENTITKVGGTLSYDNDISQQYLVFNSNSGYIKAAEGLPRTTDFTLEFWVRDIPAVSGETSTLFSCLDENFFFNNTMQLRGYVDGSRQFYIYVRDQGNVRFPTLPSGPSPTHIAITRSMSGDLTVFYDGVSQAVVGGGPTPNIGTHVFTDAPLYIGGSSGSAWYYNNTNTTPFLGGVYSVKCSSKIVYPSNFTPPAYRVVNDIDSTLVLNFDKDTSPLDRGYYWDDYLEFDATITWDESAERWTFSQKGHIHNIQTTLDTQAIIDARADYLELTNETYVDNRFVTLSRQGANVEDLGTVSGDVAVDLADANIFEFTLGGNVSNIVFSNVYTGQVVTLFIKQDSVAPYELNLNNLQATSNWKFVGGLNQVSSIQDSVTIYTLIYDGVNWWTTTAYEGSGGPAITEADLDQYIIDENIATTTYVDAEIANVTVDLTGYATESYVDTAVSDLASESYVDAEIANVTVDLTGYATESYVDAEIANVTVDLTGYATESYVDAEIANVTVDLTGYATESYVDTANANMQTYVDTSVSNLVDSAPETLDTLNELAAALGDDANFATTVSTQLGLKFNTADFDSTFDNRLATKDTGGLTEGSNLYYTDSRVNSAIAQYTGNMDNLGTVHASALYTDLIESTSPYGLTILTPTTAYGNFTVNVQTSASGYATGFQVKDTGNVLVDLDRTNSGYTSNTFKIQRSETDIFNVDYYGNATIAGDLDVAGIITGNGSGLTNVNLADKTTTDVAEGTNLYYTTARQNTDFDAQLATKDTDDVAEGSNLYYTDTRARSALSATGDLTYNSTTGEFSVTTYKSTDFNVDFGNKSTTDLSEGTNLYYTDTRANSAIDARVTADYINGLGIEGYTDTDANAAIDARVTADYINGLGIEGYTSDDANADIANYQGDISTTGNLTANVITATTGISEVDIVRKYYSEFYAQKVDTGEILVTAYSAYNGIIPDNLRALALFQSPLLYADGVGTILQVEFNNCPAEIALFEGVTVYLEQLNEAGTDFAMARVANPDENTNDDYYAIFDEDDQGDPLFDWSGGTAAPYTGYLPLAGTGNEISAGLTPAGDIDWTMKHSDDADTGALVFTNTTSARSETAVMKLRTDDTLEMIGGIEARNGISSKTLRASDGIFVDGFNAENPGTTTGIQIVDGPAGISSLSSYLISDDPRTRRGITIGASENDYANISLETIQAPSLNFTRSPEIASWVGSPSDYNDDDYGKWAGWMDFRQQLRRDRVDTFSGDVTSSLGREHSIGAIIVKNNPAKAVYVNGGDIGGGFALSANVTQGQIVFRTSQPSVVQNAVDNDYASSPVYNIAHELEESTVCYIEDKFHIGTEENSYSFPKTPGQVGQALVLGANKQLQWETVITPSNLAQYLTALGIEVPESAELPTSYDGGSSSTISFADTLDGGDSASTVFDVTVDGGNATGGDTLSGGSSSTTEFADTMDGGDSSTTTFDATTDGGNATGGDTVDAGSSSTTTFDTTLDGGDSTDTDPEDDLDGGSA